MMLCVVKQRIADRVGGVRGAAVEVDTRGRRSEGEREGGGGRRLVCLVGRPTHSLQ